MQRRKSGGQQQQAGGGSQGGNGGGSSKRSGPDNQPPPTPFDAKPARPAAGAHSRQGPGEQEAPSVLMQAAGAVLALLVLLYCHRMAVLQLAPQTGDWLAGSFCSLVLLALAVVGSVAGHVLAEATAAGAGGEGKAAMVAAQGWWAAAAAALPARALASSAGRLLLAPGLADENGLKITDTELTLLSMALGAVAFGPLFVAAGFAAGSSASCATRRLLPGNRPLLLFLPLLLGTAALGMTRGLPPALVPPKPGCTLPAVVAAAAAALAAAVMPPTALLSWPTTQQRRLVTRQQAAMAAAAVAALAAVLAGACYPCSSTVQQVEHGRYAVVWQCEAAAGGKLAVIEGTLKDKYRYRVLRFDHSVLGGEYVAPADVAGQSVYTAFYLQQAAALFRPNGTRSLHVGLGIGTAVKAMQRQGVTADLMELHPEVLEAARRFFGLRPTALGGRAMVGDAAELVPRLVWSPEARYDYVLHDVFSGGGIEPALMDVRFFRQLSRMLTPGGVLAVNYYGGKGLGLKQTFCRLRLMFDSVRAYADVEKSRVRNHVLFASNADLSTVNLEAAVAAVEAADAEAAARAAEQGGSGSSSSTESIDPLQLRVWQSMPRQEIHLTFDRQRCQQMLQQQGLPAGRGGGDGGQPGSRQPEPWAFRAMKAVREQHALAAAHWVAMRTQFADSFWLA